MAAQAQRQVPGSSVHLRDGSSAAGATQQQNARAAASVTQAHGRFAYVYNKQRIGLLHERGGATTERASTRASERARESSAGAARMSERGKEKEERARERARGKKRQRRQPRAAGAGSSKGERAQRNIRGMVHVLFFLIARALISLFSLSFLSRSRVSRSLSSNRHLCSLTYPPSAQ